MRAVGERAQGSHLSLGPSGDLWGAPSTSFFLQPMSEQAQQKLPPLALLKLGSQVQSGGAGKSKWVQREEGQSAGVAGWGRGDAVTGLMFRASEGIGWERPQMTLPLPSDLGPGLAALWHQECEGDTESEAAPLTFHL